MLPWGAVVLAFVVGAACRPHGLGEALARARHAEARRDLPRTDRPSERRRDDGAGLVVSEVLELPDGTVLRHGVERESYPSGTPRAVRHFERDVPVGEWTQWYEDGTVRSHYVHSHRPSPMTFYGPDGEVTATGDAVAGRRIGVWRFFHPSGALARTGAYEAGQRSGEWIDYDENGAVVGRAVYVAGRRTE